MRTLIVGVFTLLCLTKALSQNGITRNVESSLHRIEFAIREGSPAAVEDLIQSSIIMRLEDSLYQGISSITAMNLLKKFFAGKDSIDFRFELPGHGTMTYSTGGNRESTQVDVWLRRDRGEIGIYALNISNYPAATMFLNLHPDTSKAE